MVRSGKRIRLCATLVICNIAFIWGNSLLPGEISGAISDFVKGLLEAILGSGDGQGGGYLIRKIGHVAEFTCLGLLLRWLFDMLTRKKWQSYGMPLACGVLVAAVDETIQMFVPDRGPRITDVGIDSLGVILGIVIISLITHIKSNKMKENVL